MPIFEYDCQDCGQMVEVLVRGTETPECPVCASGSLHKRLSVPAAPVTAGQSSLPIASACDTSGPPCSPTCCRLPN